ncbi:MAG: hypothetical protein VW934_14000 [Alphaproteobacteria bacterium]|jgi:hypothetical protein
MKKSLYVVIPALVAIVGYLAMQIPFSTAPRRQIMAEFVLVNKCELPDRYFVVQQLSSGRRFRFSGKRALVKVEEGEAMKLALDSRYDEVEYNGVTFRAAAFQRVTADCSMGERQHGITDGLRGAFGG